MKGALLAVALFGLCAGRAFSQTVCAGAQGASTACAPVCSMQVVNDDVVNGTNNGKFDVGEGNQGDGNDGFNNIGNFNIGSGLEGNCLSSNTQLTGSCDPSNNNGQIAIRFCEVYYQDQKCQPSGYLAEYTAAQITAIQNAVASCTNGSPVPTVPATTPASPPPPSPVAPVTPSPPTPTTTPAAPGPNSVPTSYPTVLPPGMAAFQQLSSSSSSLTELLELFEEHIAQEKALGRKML